MWNANCAVMKNRCTEFKRKDKGYAVIFTLGGKLGFLKAYKDSASMTTTLLQLYTNYSFKLDLK